jgi:hypothetical protein
MMLPTLMVLVLASRIEPLDPAKLPAQSTLIVTGCVTDTRTTNDGPEGLHKISTIRVAAVLKGTSMGTLRVRTRTGLVFFDRHLEVGESGVFFLKVGEGGVFEAAYPGGFALFREGRTKCR